MRIIAILLSLVVAVTLPELAEAQKKKKAVPKPNPVVAAYAAMPVADRIAIQGDLVWTGDYNGLVNGDFGERSIAAVKAFQRRNGGKDSGVLNPQERAALAAAAKTKQEAAGWRVVDDPSSGARLGVPLKITPQATAQKDGNRWSSARGEVQIETFRIKEPGTTLAAVFEKQKKEPAGRKIAYNLLRPDFFVLSGLQGLKKFYVRGQLKDNEVRGIAILYDQAMEGIMSPVVIAMSNAFQAFPAGAVAGLPPKRKVDYGTAIVKDRRPRAAARLRRARPQSSRPRRGQGRRRDAGRHRRSADAGRRRRGDDGRRAAQPGGQPDAAAGAGAQSRFLRRRRPRRPGPARRHGAAQSPGRRRTRAGAARHPRYDQEIPRRAESRIAPLHPRRHRRRQAFGRAGDLRAQMRPRVLPPSS